MFDLAQLAAHPFLARLEHHAALPSTNDRALQLAADPHLKTPALVLAEQQTAGRGRGANRWWAAKGALTFSLVLDPAQLRLPAERWPQLSLATAVAVASALEVLGPGVRLGVKWPNDVHADGRKISGILVEVPGAAASGERRIIVGVGVNVNNSWHAAPPELQAVGTSLRDLTGSEHDLTDVLCELLSGMEMRLAQLATHDARLSSAWQALCVLRGRHVEIDLGTRQIAGSCAGTDLDGALLIQTASGQERVYGGVVRAIR